MNELKIFSGSSNTGLAAKICGHLQEKNGSPNSYTLQGDIYRHVFPQGEKYCQYKENIRGRDVFLVQSTNSPTNDNFMELCIMADAARRASAGRITAVIPYFGYARQDRKTKSRTPISARLVTDMLQAAGVQRIMTMDLHCPQIQGFTNLPLDHLFSVQPILDYIKSLNIAPYVLSPDIGAAKRSTAYSKLLNADIGFVIKERVGDSHVEVDGVVGDIKGKDVVVFDDMSESLGTLIASAEICKEHGAKSFRAVVAHGIFTRSAVNRAVLKGELFDELIYTDTAYTPYQNDLSEHVNTKKISVAEIFAEAILNVHLNRSVSNLFPFEGF